ncbi:MAG TPA: GGDEF domain-containing protein [Bordetella sp.]|nr:GGDEF domain-containing protein [Bordetella sp.]
MYVDLLTLYQLAIGTLLASAGILFWEHRSNRQRSKELRILASGFATLAIGCASVMFRRDVPLLIGAAVSNLVMLCGYLLILNGVASLRGRQYRAGSVGMLMAMALVWTIAGTPWLDAVWNYASALPIAAISAMTAWEMLRCDAMRPVQARRIVVAVMGIHAAVYTARAFILPWLVTAYGQATLALAGKITIYEGVLYSVVLPMTLLKLIREETHGQLLRESQTDYLTRLGNRRWFFEEGERIIDGSRRTGPVAILAFDLDQFKAINDLHGHQTGDKVLKWFAQIARGAMGSDAILARIGGEEFAALLTGDDARGARELGETVAKHFAETISNGVDGIRIPATVSIGLAQFENEVPALADGLAAADRALYRAKSLGGNCLELAPTAELRAAE